LGRLNDCTLQQRQRFNGEEGTKAQKRSKHHEVYSFNPDFEETTATAPEEIRKLGKDGWTKYDEITVNGIQMHFYRKPKRFGVV
jgi:galactokinase